MARPPTAATAPRSGGGYQLRELDGSLTVFNADGTLAYVQDSNGNRITAAYTNGLLTSLTGSSGAFITLSYNTQGLLTGLQTSDGHQASYAYDASGQHLISYTNEDGTTTYSYLTAQSNPALENALAQIAYSDNTHIYFTYDSQGRLTRPCAASAIRRRKTQRSRLGASANSAVYGASVKLSADVSASPSPPSEL